MADNHKPLGFGGDYSRLLQCIADLRALVLPMVEAQEAKKAETPPEVVPQDAQQGLTLPVGEHQETRSFKRKRTGLSAFHYDCSTTGKPTRSFATERVSLDSV